MSDAGEKCHMTATVDPENKAHLEEQDNASALVNRLLTAHRIGGDDADRAVNRMREQQLESERRQLELQLEAVTNDLEAMKEVRASREEERAALLEEAFDVLDDVACSPDNPAVENWARKLAMSPHELIAEYESRDEE